MLARDNVKPKKKRGNSEYLLQCQCVEWFKREFPSFVIYSVPNEACRTKFQHFKQSGALAGVSDLVIVTDRVVLFIEMKSENGRQRTEQKAFQEKIESLGYKYFLCRTFDDFKYIIMSNL